MSVTEKPTRRWWILVVLSVAQLMDIIDNTIVNIALPQAQDELQFSDAARGWVITGYALAFGTFLLVGGRLADQVGRKRLFPIGVVGFAVASAVGGASSGIGMLLAARIGQGAFAAMLAPAALSLLSLTFRDDGAERGKAFGIFGAISGAGGAVGLILGGVLTQTLSWRWCLFVNIPIAAVAVIGGLIVIRDSRPSSARRMDWPGAVAAVAGTTGVVLGLSTAATEGWGSPATLVPIAVGILILVGFVALERRAADPLLPLGVVLDRTRGASYLSAAISGTGMFAIFLFLTFYLEQTLGFTPVGAGVSFLPMIGAVVVGAVVSGTLLMPRVGPRPLVPAGALLAAAGLILLTGIGPDSSYPSAVLPGLLTAGLGIGLIFGPVQNAGTSGVREGQDGVASAMIVTAQQIGGSLGIALFSSIFALATGSAVAAFGAVTLAAYHTVFWVGAGIFVAAAAIAAILFRSGPIPAGPEAGGPEAPADPEARPA